MDEKTYKKITRPIRKLPYGVKIINLLNKLTTTSVYLIYPIALFILAYQRDMRIWKTILIPGVSFIIVSIFRSYINKARPYELLDIDPIIDKSTVGNSFPSRHVFSVFVIAMTLYYIWNPLGIILMLVGIVISIIRVIGGVHFPRDVIAGAIIGIVSAMIGQNLMI